MQKRNEYEWLGGGSVQHAVGLSFAKKHLHLITFQKAQCGGGWKGREWIPGASSWPRDPASGSPRLRSFTCVGGRDMGYARSLRGRRVARTTHTYDVRRGYSCAGANRTPRGVHKTTHLRARTHTHTPVRTHASVALHSLCPRVLNPCSRRPGKSFRSQFLKP